MMRTVESTPALKEAVAALENIPGHAELLSMLEQSEAVSFDFFDTLFIRPLAHPEDAFDLLGRRFGIEDFRARRRAAQVEAFRRMNAAGRKEITLAGIYECFSDSSVAGSDLMQAEYALEMALVEPNPEIFPLFAALIDAGKMVVVTSDMYLSADFFIEALRPHGLAHLPLFISADCNATKRDTGALFEVLIDKLAVPAAKILHIGDNLQADVTRPREKGLMAFHYRESRELLVKKNASLATSLGHGLLRTRAREIPAGSYAELGFLYGGAANAGFLQWIAERARLDGIDHVLFLSRDGYALERLARKSAAAEFPEFCYFLGSRTAYTLAAIHADNFSQFIPFLLSGSDGLAPGELLERIGVQPPSAQVMEDLGLGSGVRVSVALHEKLAGFLHAMRWDILKVCRRNRRALHCYLRQLGIHQGSRVALVDVGWSGTTQEAFELAVRSLVDIEVFGYYFCLAETPERLRRDGIQRMSAMVSATSTSPATVAEIYANRVAVELFFSAPHPSVIGLQVGADGIEPVLDAGRGQEGNLTQIAHEVLEGVEIFAEHYDALHQRLDIRASPLQMAWPLVELASEKNALSHQLLQQVKSFDAWSSSRNHALTLEDYRRSA
jgi:FMN phosphatase YigB (HAD superfamily)